MKTLILQSHAPNPPSWIKQCTASVRAFAQRNGYEYRFIGEELFGKVPRKFDHFARVTITDLGRLQWILWYANVGGLEVYWIDADILIWDVNAFELPPCQSGAVVCAREAWFLQRRTGGVMNLRVNNSVLGFCDPNDVEVLIERSTAILNSRIGRERQTAPTVIGTDFFSSPSFPLRKIEMKSVGCFSPDSGKALAHLSTGFAHLWSLGMANGSTLHAANLCNAAKRTDDEMDELVYLLNAHRSHELGRWRYVAPIWRIALRVIRWADHVRWIMRGRPALDPIQTSAVP